MDASADFPPALAAGDGSSDDGAADWAAEIRTSPRSAASDEDAVDPEIHEQWAAEGRLCQPFTGRGVDVAVANPNPADAASSELVLAEAQQPPRVTQQRFRQQARLWAARLQALRSPLDKLLLSSTQVHGAARDATSVGNQSAHDSREDGDTLSDDGPIEATAAAGSHGELAIYLPGDEPQPQQFSLAQYFFEATNALAELGSNIKLVAGVPQDQQAAKICSHINTHSRSGLTYASAHQAAVSLQVDRCTFKRKSSEIASIAIFLLPWQLRRALGCIQSDVRAGHGRLVQFILSLRADETPMSVVLVDPAHVDAHSLPQEFSGTKEEVQHFVRQALSGSRDKCVAKLLQIEWQASVYFPNTQYVPYCSVLGTGCVIDRLITSLRLPIA